MKTQTQKATPSAIGVNGDGAQCLKNALTGLEKALVEIHGWTPVDDELTTSSSDVIEAGQGRTRHDEQTGTVVFPVQTVGPNAKELERRRLLAEGGSRHTRPDRVREPVSRARPRERREHRSPGPSRAGPDDDDGPSSGPAERRLCENTRCEKDISQRHPAAHYCNDACQQQAYRDRQRDAHLDELVGTTTWEFSCKHDDDHEVPHGWAPDGVCFKCGRVRGAVTRGWLGDGPSEHGSVVNAPAPKRKSPRLGDGSRKLVYTDEHGECRRLTDKGVIAA